MEFSTRYELADMSHEEIQEHLADCERLSTLLFEYPGYEDLRIQELGELIRILDAEKREEYIRATMQRVYEAVSAEKISRQAGLELIAAFSRSYAAEA